jgi:hypothetical protein
MVRRLLNEIRFRISIDAVRLAPLFLRAKDQPRKAVEVVMKFIRKGDPAKKGTPIGEDIVLDGELVTEPRSFDIYYREHDPLLIERVTDYAKRGDLIITGPDGLRHKIPSDIVRARFKPGDSYAQEAWDNVFILFRNFEGILSNDRKDRQQNYFRSKADAMFFSENPLSKCKTGWIFRRRNQKPLSVVTPDD